MIKRHLLPRLIAHLSRPEITLIIGPRQAGKTTLMRLLIDHLAAQGQKSLFLNFDLERDRPFLKTQQDLLSKMRLEIGTGGYVFLDEIQRKENAGLFLKGLADMNLPYKFIVSGSGSLELKESIFESLAGRKRVFELYPLTFFEFLDYKTNYAYRERLHDYLHVEQTQSEGYLKEFLSFGGYPKVVLATTQEEKTAAIADVFESYLARDITSLLRLKKSESVMQLVRLLSGQMGQLINYHELSSTTGISQKTLKRYLWYLEQTFIGARLTPFTHRLRKEIVKSPIFYFSDVGMANYATGDFFLQEFPVLGLRFQTMIYGELRRLLLRGADSLHYWRTKDGAEVDFVIERGNRIIPIEVKLTSITQPTVPDGLKRFIRKYHPQSAFVVNLTDAGSLTFEETRVRIIPYYELEYALHAP